MINNRTRLNEMDFMRPIVIVLLVMMHSFTIYSGGGSWDYPTGIHSVTAYKWVQVLSYGCMLEAFTFISGYLFGFQLNRKNMSFGSLIVSKLKRLIVPSLVFSAIYSMLFHVEWGGVNNWSSIIYETIFGAGHLWYLPMLFLCFIVSWLLVKVRVNDFLKYIILFAISILSILPLPFGLNAMFHYLPFFYLGIYLFNNPLQVSLKGSILFIVSFLVLLIIVVLYRQSHPTMMTWQKALFWYLKQTYATLGTLGVFSLCKLVGQRKNAGKALLEFNGNCFGVYIFHQFLLVFLYYYTPLPQMLGSYALPWFGLFAAFIISYFLTYVFRINKIGRFLMG